MKNPNPRSEATLWRTLADLEERGDAAALVTVVGTSGSTPRHAGARMVVQADGSVSGTIGGGRAEAAAVEAALAALESGECALLDLDLVTQLGVCGGKMQVFVEPVLAGLPLIIVGAGHVGAAVARMAHDLPLRLTVVDDRRELLDRMADLCGVARWEETPDTFAGRLRVPPRGGILIASRDHELDARYLAAVFAAERQQGREFAFCGLLASRRKAEKLRTRVATDEALQQRWERLQVPVGLDLVAETPAEIALSILAEAMAVLRGVEPLNDATGAPLAIRLHRRRGEQP